MFSLERELRNQLLARRQDFCGKKKQKKRGVPPSQILQWSVWFSSGHMI